METGIETGGTTMSRIIDEHVSFTYRPGENKEALVLRSKIAILVAKRSQALTELGEKAIPLLKDNPDFAVLATEIAEYGEEIEVLEKQEAELLSK